MPPLKLDLNSVKSILRSDGSSAIACYFAVKALLGNFEDWEPESIWFALEQHGVELTALVQAKIMAALSMEIVSSFYWDANVFENICIVMNHELNHPDILHDPFPHQVAWGVYEANMIRAATGQSIPEFQHEPIAYTAVVLHKNGMVVAPEELSFAQNTLDKLTANLELKKEVLSKWDKLDKTTLSQVAFSESPIDVQLARLASIYLYIQDKKAIVNSELANVR